MDAQAFEVEGALARAETGVAACRTVSTAVVGRDGRGEGGALVVAVREKEFFAF